MKEFLEVGKITSAHGLRGEVKIELWCDGVEFLAAFNALYLDDEGKEKLTVKSVRRQKNGAIIKFDEISDINAAEALRGKALLCKRSDAPLEKGRHFIADLIGCRVIDIETKKEYGTVSGVENYGASDILEIKSDKGLRLVPLINEIVKEIDAKQSYIAIQNMKGLFDEN